MDTRCSICNHPRLAEIDASLEAGWTLRAVEARFKKTSRSALGRHNQHRPELVIEYRQQLVEQIAGIARAHLEELVVPELERLRASLELAELELAFARPAARDGK